MRTIIPVVAENKKEFFRNENKKNATARNENHNGKKNERETMGAQQSRVATRYVTSQSTDHGQTPKENGRNSTFPAAPAADIPVAGTLLGMSCNQAPYDETQPSSM